MHAITVTYRHQVAALAAPAHVWLAAHVLALPNGDAAKRMVCFMCFFAREVLTGQFPGPYTDQRARTFARLALIDPILFAQHEHLDDEQLAELVGVPLDEITAARADHAQATMTARSRDNDHPCR